MMMMMISIWWILNMVEIYLYVYVEMYMLRWEIWFHVSFTPIYSKVFLIFTFHKVRCRFFVMIKLRGSIRSRWLIFKTFGSRLSIGPKACFHWRRAPGTPKLPPPPSHPFVLTHPCGLINARSGGLIMTRRRSN